MFRKLTLTIAALAVSSAALVSADAQAKPNVPNKGPIKIAKPFKPVQPHKPHFHGHGHFKPVYIVERPYVRPVALVSERPVVRNTCNCLTKDYTPDGVVIFKDLCTKETASAPLPGSPAAAQQQQGEAASPNNFAGKTFDEFKAAQTQSNAAQQN